MAHKVFVSYHHANDQKKAEYLRDEYDSNNTLLDKSLDEAYEDMSDDEILAAIRTEHLKDSTVTIVLIGSETANRKWVDWEIYSSLRPYGYRSRNGLLGIYLPTAGAAPARLQDNIDSGYAITMKWENISWQLESKIQEAFDNRSKVDLVVNSRKRRERNS
ncbi:MAG: TIR domain-containing protein [Proteocatella sp.]